MNAHIIRGLLIAALVTPAVAAAANREEKSSRSDPNRIICERQELIGTRLGSKRVCLTAAEWKARRQQDRQDIDRSQTQRGSNGN